MDSYNKTQWINGRAPALNAENLNKIEQGIYDVTEETKKKVNLHRIDSETSADWDGEIPVTYEGELGDLALYDQCLWFLYNIAEYEGTLNYYWTKLLDAES